MKMTTAPGYRIVGGAPVTGEITCYGAKNFATKAMVAACLGDGPTTLSNMPPIGDVEITGNMLKAIGAKVEWVDATTLRIDPTGADSHRVTMPDSRSNRVPILLLPVLLHRFGKAEIPRLDGCNIGRRSVDIHEAAVKAFGGHMNVRRDKFEARIRKELEGTHFALHYPSVGATETCLFLSVMSRGTSVIKNAAIEPEIIELVTMLRSMGAIIFLGPNREIRVEGVSRLHGTHMHVLGDRIEAASWACLACASDGRITVRGIRPNTLGNFLSTYRQVGGGFTFEGDDVITFYREGPLRAITLETGVYPGFSTDWQQPFAVLLTQAEGMSVIHETVYENRFGYTGTLNTLGAHIQLSTQCLGSQCRFENKNYEHSALIMGKTPLKAVAEPIEVPDLRAGLGYLIAAAIAEGESTLAGIERIERGYGNVVERLSSFALNIERVDVSSPVVEEKLTSLL
jgi:UDP-N-acetylglucosamine 1-carboxyvinyltransferase